MGYKKLLTPEFRVVLKNHILTSGMEVEVFSSRETRCDWCKIQLTSQLQNIITYEDMEEITVRLGYEDEYDTLITGYARKTAQDYWKEILIKDDMIKLERLELKATFMQCEPKDILRYILTQAGIENYVLSDAIYEKKDIFILNRQNGVQAILEMNSMWGIENSFFFHNHVFYWGCSPEQSEVYILEEDNNILSFEKYGDLWEIETLGIPWIHHSQRLEVHHAKCNGLVTVEKTIIKSDSEGRTRMYVYFKGG